MNNLRNKREFIRMLIDKKIIDKQTYRQLYLKAKGGYFRSIRHIKLYIEEHDLALIKHTEITNIDDKAKTEKPKKRFSTNNK